MSVSESSADARISLVLQRCQALMQTADTIINSKVTGVDKQEQCLIEEFRFQVETLRAKTQALSREIQPTYHESAMPRQWVQLQTVTQRLLSDCRNLLQTINNNTLKDRSLSDDSIAPSGPASKPKKQRFTLAMRGSAPKWIKKDMERIQDIISYCKAINLIRKLNLLFVGSVVWRTPDTQLRALEDQVYDGIYPSNCFKAAQSTIADQSQASGNRHPILKAFVDLAMDAMELKRVSLDQRPAPRNQTSPTNHSTALASPQGVPRTESSSSNTTPTSQPQLTNSQPSTDSDTLPSDFSSVSLNDGSSLGPVQGNGAPDYVDDPDDSGNLVHNVNGRTPTTTSSSQIDLGQQIQLLLQQQLEQDQRARRILEQRVSQLEEQCSLANKKAEQESKRADQASSQFRLLESETERTISALTDRHNQEMAHYKHEIAVLRKDKMALQTELTGSKQESQRMYQEAVVHRQLMKQKQNELEQSLRQQQQVQEVVKTWSQK